MASLLPDLPPALRDNPFFEFSAENNFAPAWDKIRPHHVMPAFEYAVAHTQKNIDAILSHTDKPTFDNTLEAFNGSFDLVIYLFHVFFNLMPEDENVSKYYDSITEKLILDFYERFSGIYQDKGFYERLRKIRLTDDEKKSIEKEKLLKGTLNAFKEGGIGLDQKSRARLHELELDLIKLELKAIENIKRARETTYLIVDNKDELKGLSAFSLQAAAQKAEKTGHPGKWAFSTERENYEPFMRTAQNRKLRKKFYRIYNAVATKGAYNNLPLARKILKVRHESARLLGYKSPALQTMQYHVMTSPKTAMRFMDSLRKAATPSAEREMKLIASFAYEFGHIKNPKPWDVPYYEEQLKKTVLGFDEEELRPYFEFERVLEGTLRHFTKQLDLHFEQTKDYPVPHKDVRAYKVYHDKTGRFMGVIYLDLFDRKGKYPFIAWSCSVLKQGKFLQTIRRPVDMVVAKFQKGAAGQATLLSHDNITVLIHELGHAVQNLCSECEYPEFAGTNVKRDIVEFASQFQENWAYEREFLDTIAFHHETGAPLSAEIKKKIQASRKFMAGSRTLALAKKGWLDLALHTTDPKKIGSLRSFEKKQLAPFRVLAMDGEFISPTFSHILGGGYDCAVYTYQYDQVWEADAFASFKRKGLYDPDLCRRYGRIMADGDRHHIKQLYHDAFGRFEPSPAAFMKRNGFVGPAFNYLAGARAVKSSLSETDVAETDVAETDMVQRPARPENYAPAVA